MPGLMGVVTPAGGPGTLEQAVRLASATDQGCAGVRRSQWVDPRGHWAFAASDLFETPTSVRLDDVTAIVCGRIDSTDAKDGGAAAVAAAYQRSGVRGLSHLQGAFAAVIVDEAEHTAWLVADLLGTFPLYYSMDRERLVFGPSLTSLVRSLSQRVALDVGAASDYVHFGFVMGTKTLARGIAMVPQGGAVGFCWRDGSSRVHVHQRPVDLFARIDSTRPAYHDGVAQAFNDAVERCSRTDRQLGLSLSGGLDSRAILSAVDTRRKPVATYTVGAPLCADHLIANRLSRLTGTRHYFLALQDSYLRDFLPNLDRMVALTDGMYLSHGLTEMLALEAVQQSGIEVLLRGHCGEMAKTNLAWPAHTDASVFRMGDRRQLVPYLFRRMGYVAGGASLDRLLCDMPEGAHEQSARRSLESAVDGVELTPPELCSYVYLTQHHRRFTIPSLELFRARVEIRQPYADQRFLRALLGGRPEWRAATDVHRHITRHNNPRVLRVRNSNTGAPGSAGPFVERVLDPVNSVLKRLNVPGYRHYHRFDLWMREQLLTSVEEILCDDMTTRRGVFNRAAIEHLLTQTRRGNGDHAYLLQILLVLELWQRQAEAA